jgi:hypothetical protein
MLKAKDFTTLILLIGVSAVVSFLLSRVLFSNTKTLTSKVEVVNPVSSEFNYENKSYFSEDKLNPTKDITVSGNNNTDPLGQ